ncbi:c-type cytochrome [Haliea sp. E1-2-M8]|uniref:c-type cytochrome n=1 Tax=Haliea sp. E1-2-M8 TaxID=3064706 RepID=UPI00271BA420|nr:c-type cytochrome [Haliea sp. E1-2-M8]MDO8863129.1 c-type cytochrome [Haliea sp. E1-2-M8]
MISKVFGLGLGLMLSGICHADGAAIANTGVEAAPACQTCHGPAGEGVAQAGFPRLASLGAAYLQRQLDAFADGTRVNDVMMPIASALSDADRAAVSAYYAALPEPASLAPAAEPVSASAGASLATSGRWADMLPACEQCHGPGGRGVGPDFPPLTGQSATYLSNQLTAWQTGARPPGPLGLMAVIAEKLSEAEVRAVADHYAALESAPPDSAAATPPAAGDLPGDPPRADPTAPAASAVFQPPPESELPAGEFGDVVRRGREIFIATPHAAPTYVGNSLRCVSCHLNAGRLADSSPMWAAFVSYPAYRSKTKSVATFQQRLQGCFMYSMNGRAPPLGAPELVALESYAYWLASGAPLDPKIAGRGYPALEPPAQSADFIRGEKVYAENCALCHGDDGTGQRTESGYAVFPALWGSDSFNWGAGMGRISNAAAFIKANMPLALPGTLTKQQAWDVALYMNSHERPQDPRYTGSVQGTRDNFHATGDSMYGREVAGKVLGASGGEKTDPE